MISLVVDKFYHTNYGFIYTFHAYTSSYYFRLKWMYCDNRVCVSNFNAVQFFLKRNFFLGVEKVNYFTILRNDNFKNHYYNHIIVISILSFSVNSFVCLFSFCIYHLSCCWQQTIVCLLYFFSRLVLAKLM